MKQERKPLAESKGQAGEGNQRMRLLFLTNMLSPYRVAFFDELGKYMDVTVLYTSGTEDVKDRNREWFEEGQGGFRGIHLKKTVKLGEDNLCLEVVKWLKKDYDCVIVGGYAPATSMLAMVCLHRKRIPFYLEIDGGVIREESRLKYGVKRFLVSLPNRCLSSGHISTEALIHYGAQPKDILEYPFTSLSEKDLLETPPTQEEKKTLRQELGVQEKRMILAVGQFIPRKGFDILLRSAGKLPEDVGIYIVGGEPTQEYLQLCQDLRLKHVHFRGFQKKDALDKYFRAADLFVLPTREDIWGLVINEAMAKGLPVITTDNCVAGLELVENGVSGYIVPVDDPEALAEKLTLALSQNCRALGAAALEKIRPYTLENMAKVHWDILREKEVTQ